MDAITKKAHLRIIKWILFTIIGLIFFLGGIIWLGHHFLLVILLGVVIAICIGAYQSALDSVKSDIEREIKRNM